MRFLLGAIVGATLGVLIRRLIAAGLVLVVLGIALGPIDRLGPLRTNGTGVVDRLSSIRIDGVSTDAIADRLTAAMKTADSAEVTRAVDGDTLVVRVDGKSERVRVLGIDTPETVKPGAAVDCFGPQASRNAKSWVKKHPRVRLQRDAAAPDRDRYERLLRYVSPTDGTRDLSTVQVNGGFARVAAYGQKLSKLDALRAAERRARRADRGLWGACSR